MIFSENRYTLFRIMRLAHIPVSAAREVRVTWIAYADVALEPPERFRAKWIPVRMKKTRQNKKLEPPFRFNRNGSSR
jgi:hypothetical protein